MADSIELRSESWIPESVRKRIADFLKPNAGYLKSGVPEVKKISALGDGAVAYAVTVRGKVPDAYFDTKGNFLFSVSGVLDFDGWPTKSAAARDAFRLAEFKMSETNSWRTFFSDSWSASNPDGKASEPTVLEPFSVETFRKVRDLAFHQDRIDIARREYAKTSSRPDLEPYSDADVEALASSRTITISDLVKLKKVGLVSEKTFSKHKKEVAKLLPSQILDSRFAKPIKVRGTNGAVLEARPSWHGISREELDALSREWHVDAATYKATLDAFEALKKRAAEYEMIIKESGSKYSSLKSHVTA